MDRIIDARGLECPKPVILTAEAMESTGDVTVIVDNTAARENVTRLATGRGFTVNVKDKSDGTYLRLVKQETEAQPASVGAAGTVIFIGSDKIGQGENIQLGQLLMQSFLNTLGGLTEKPEAIVFMNSGVTLVTTESPVLGELKQLAGQGVELLACGTCLSRLGRTEKLAVGTISNMYTLAKTMLRAGKVLTL